MKRKKKKIVQVTDRDKTLFLYLYENKVASQKQIRRDVFNRVTQQTVSRRLLKLQKEKLLSLEVLREDAKVKNIYSITDKAFDLYVLDKFKGSKRRQFKSHCPFHDLDLVEIRHFLCKKKQVVGYISENILQSGIALPNQALFAALVEHNPDAVLQVKQDKEEFIFCLEYDASSKSLDRYEDILKSYYFDKEVVAVFFIHKEKSSLENLIALENKIFSFRTPKLFHATLTEILNSKGKIYFVNFKNSILTIN